MWSANRTSSISSEIMAKKNGDAASVEEINVLDITLNMSRHRGIELEAAAQSDNINVLDISERIALDISERNDLDTKSEENVLDISERIVLDISERIDSETKNSGGATNAISKQKLDDLRAMAVVLSVQDKLEESMAVFQKVLDTRMKYLGRDQKDVAESYHKIKAGNLHLHGALQEEALHLDHRQNALEMYGKGGLLPQDADARVLNIAISCEHISDNSESSEHDEDTLEEALAAYQLMFDIFDNAWGQNDPDTAMALYFLGEILCKLEKLEEAEKMLKQFLKWYGPDSSYAAKGGEWMDMILEQ